jgi:hypothetical protein
MSSLPSNPCVRRGQRGAARPAEHAVKPPRHGGFCDQAHRRSSHPRGSKHAHGLVRNSVSLATLDVTNAKIRDDRRATRLSRRVLDGCPSRWTIPCWCAVATPLQTRANRRTTGMDMPIEATQRRYRSAHSMSEVELSPERSSDCRDSMALQCLKAGLANGPKTCHSRNLHEERRTLLISAPCRLGPFALN